MDEVKLQTEAGQKSGSPLDQSSAASQFSLSPPVQQHPMHRVFIGPNGLRAGWRLLIYVALVFLLYGLAAVALPRNTHGIWRKLADELRFMAAALLPALLMGAIEKRPFGAYGLPGQLAFGRLFWAGVIWGIAAISLLVFAIGGVGDFSLGSVALHGVRILKFAVFWGGFFLVVGFFEEFLLRGYSQFTLATGMGFWPAAVLLSVIFAVMHVGNPGETFIGLVAVAAIGLFFCLTLYRTGNLWFAVGFHASFDWGESYLYSVRDSGTTVTGHLLNSSFHGSRWITGGSVGPEGSVFVFVVIALTWVAFDRMYPEVKYGPDGSLSQIISGV
jgi:membrane protease YdiL (CAAX protease family)